MTDYSTDSNELIEFGIEQVDPNIQGSPFYSNVKKQKRQVAVNDYIDKLFKRYARLLVVRVDMNYRMDVSQSKTIDDVIKDFIDYRNNERWNDVVFDGKVGYIRLVEYGQDKGFHIHYIAFYDGSKRKGDTWLADKIGELWNRTTHGLGCHWNCNTQHYDTRAIGMLHRNDVKLINHLKNVVASYLTKLTQQPKYLQGRQLFRMGVIGRL